MSINRHQVLDAAIKFAVEKHAGQLDKAGLPYILHPLAVMNSMETIEEMIVGVLHDVLEDTDATTDDLRRIGLNEFEIEGVMAVTRQDGEVYISEFIPRAKAHPLGRAVKIKDVHHNLSRISNLPPEERGIEKRYHKALAILEE